MKSPSMFVFVFTLSLGLSPTRGQETDRARIQFFETRIRPVLVGNCYECHSVESGKSKGGLRVDSRDALLTGGKSGPAIVPGLPAKSFLYNAITSHDDDIHMPPKKMLPDLVIADVRKWIEMGAPDPRIAVVHAAPASKRQIDIAAGRRFWSYQKPIKPPVPKTMDATWPRTDIDRFVLARLEAAKLKPVGDADKLTLIRRVTFVLTGLPPTPQAIDAFLNDTAKDAFPKVVDRLLESPQFGEHWGRHWMDVARYAESTGGDRNNIYQQAWRYRDYVIDSFNADKPFDQFIREQVAGDLLPATSPKQRGEATVATGFLAIGTKQVGEEKTDQFFADLVDDQIDTTMRAFIATSVSCARCHDHKYDPIPQVDYYAVAAMFRATETRYGLIQAQAGRATPLIDLTGMGLPTGSPAASKQKLVELTKDRDDAKAAVDDAMKQIRAGQNVFRGKLRRLRSDRDETEAALQAFGVDGQAKVLAMGVLDRAAAPETRLLVRGEVDKPAQAVQRGFPQVVSQPGKQTLPSNTKGSGRIELARWLTSDQNPLSARVIANRIWCWTVGQGLVRSVDDFGTMGEMPSHPELLDFLALRMIEKKWSVKALVREIVLSRTWQLASDFNEANFAVDPDNRFLWHASKRRLEAESIRDAMLAAAGTLDPSRPIGTLLRDVGEGGVGMNVFEPVIRAIESNHRSVYLPRVRGVMPEMLDLFDAPDASTVMGMREITAGPLQSLFLMNNPFAQKQADAMARRVASQPSEKQLDLAYVLARGHGPSPEERQRATAFLSELGRKPGAGAESALAALCQALFCAAEFSSID